METCEFSTTGTAMRPGSVAPTLHDLMGDVCPQPARRRRVLGGMSVAGTGYAAPGLPPSAPPIT